MEIALGIVKYVIYLIVGIFIYSAGKKTNENKVLEESMGDVVKAKKNIEYIESLSGSERTNLLLELTKK